MMIQGKRKSMEIYSECILVNREEYVLTQGLKDTLLYILFQLEILSFLCHFIGLPDDRVTGRKFHATVFDHSKKENNKDINNT